MYVCCGKKLFIQARAKYQRAMFMRENLQRTAAVAAAATAAVQAVSITQAKMATN